MRPRLVALLKAPRQTERGEASALAALILLDSPRAGGIPTALWKRLGDWIAAHPATSSKAWAKLPAERRKLVGPRHAALSLLLCVAAASGSAAQKQQCRQWARPLGEVWDEARNSVDYGLPFGFGLADTHHALLDPAAFAANATNDVPLWLLRDVVTQLRTGAPDLALALLCRKMGNDSGQSLPWLLPELHQASPRYAALYADYLHGLASGPGLVPSTDTSRLDAWLSQAAFRMAPIDLEQALAMWQAIKSPDERAETIAAIAGLLPALEANAKTHSPAHAARLDALVEGALNAEIAAWKPSKRNDSAVPELVRLALWRAWRGRKVAAMQGLKGAEARMGKLPATAFRDAWAIARAYRDLKAPQARAWLDKAVASAIVLDRAADEPGGGGSFYFAASTIVADELVRLGRLDDALSLAKQLEDARLHSNADIVLSMSVAALGRSGSRADLERLRKMLPDLQDRPRRSALSALAEDKARTDLPGALKMLDKLSPEARIGAVLRLASRAPSLGTPLLRLEVQQAVASHLKARRARRNHDAQDLIFRFLDELSASQMDSLAPAFKGEPGEFAWQMLGAVARDKGLGADPLWQRVWGIRHSGSSPLGISKLVYVQQAEAAQPKLLPAPPLPRLP